MKYNSNYNYQPMEQPVNISEQIWDKNVRPLVSISCITYNHVNFIRDAFEGFLMQKTTFPVEILVHDDASTDGTDLVVREYEGKFPELIKGYYQPENTYKNPNQKALIRPFRNARKGKYIALCEGDDYWTDPLKLQKQVDFLEENQGFVMSYHAYRIQRGEIIQEKILPRKGGDFTGDELIATPPGIATATKLFRNVLKNNDGTKGELVGGDYFLNVYLGTFGSCKYLSTVKPSVYRLHSGGVWSSKDKAAKHFGLINTRIRVYHYFRDIHDERRMMISLKALRKAIDEEMFFLDPDYKSLVVGRSELSFTYKKVRFYFYYRPLLMFLRDKLKHLLSKRYLI